MLSEDKFATFKNSTISYGDVSLLAIPTIFKKIKFNTHDNIGSGKIHIPPMEMHTNSTWLSFDLPNDWSEEQISETLNGVAYAMGSFIPLFLHCDRTDISVVPQVKAVHNEKPTLFIYDSYPGGIGLSERVYDIILSLLERTLIHIKACPCQNGCPACTGAPNSLMESKRDVMRVIQKLIAELE